MILSTQTKVLSRKLGHETAIRMIADAGFDAFDLTLGRIQMAGAKNSPYGNNDGVFVSDEYMDYVLKLKKNSRRKKYNLQSGSCTVALTDLR